MNVMFFFSFLFLSSGVLKRTRGLILFLEIFVFLFLLFVNLFYFLLFLTVSDLAALV